MFRKTVQLSFVVAAVAERSAEHPSVSEYEAHLKEYGISRAEDHVGREARRAIFNRRMREIENHNADPRLPLRRTPTRDSSRIYPIVSQ